MPSFGGFSVGGSSPAPARNQMMQQPGLRPDEDMDSQLTKLDQGTVPQGNLSQARQAMPQQPQQPQLQRLMQMLQGGMGVGQQPRR